MITLTTNPTCPGGLAALVALEQLGVRYELVVVPEGAIQREHGGPGPQLVEDGVARLGREAVATVVERALDAADASPALRAAYRHVSARVVPAIVAGLTSAGAAAELRTALAELVPLVDAIGPLEWASGAAAATMVGLARFLRRCPDYRDACPTILPRLEALWASAPRLRAEARRAAAQAVVAPEEVLSFWFGAPIADEADAMARAKRWFQGGAALDGEVRERFLPTIEAALRGELDRWAATIRGRLALVLVLDQLTRNAFRGDPRTWSGDARARALCEEALSQGLTAQLSWIEARFLTLPLLHAEDAAAQARGRAFTVAAAASVPPELRRLAAAGLEQSEKYGAIIARFGRFPFRNEILGRNSTPEELAFLADFAGKQAPQAMRAEQGASSS